MVQHRPKFMSVARIHLTPEGFGLGCLASFQLLIYRGSNCIANKHGVCVDIHFSVLILKTPTNFLLLKATVGELE